MPQNAFSKVTLLPSRCFFVHVRALLKFNRTLIFRQFSVWFIMKFDVCISKEIVKK